MKAGVAVKTRNSHSDSLVRLYFHWIHDTSGKVLMFSQNNELYFIVSEFDKIIKVEDFSSPEKLNCTIKRNKPLALKINDYSKKLD